MYFHAAQALNLLKEYNPKYIWFKISSSIGMIFQYGFPIYFAFRGGWQYALFLFIAGLLSIAIIYNAVRGLRLIKTEMAFVFAGFIVMPICIGILIISQIFA